MKIQIVSDFHADVRWPQSLAIGADVKVVIAAGDICQDALHQRSKSFIATELARPVAATTTVVVTHHGPHRGSVHPRYCDDLLTGGFVSDCEDLILASRPHLWVHGHTHNCADYLVGATRVICNAHGYGNENPAFDPSLVVEVGT
jgi:Icc-related predicted phosphoesterase